MWSPVFPLSFAAKAFLLPVDLSEFAETTFLTFKKKWRPSVASLPSFGGSYVLDICKPHLIEGQRAVEKVGGIVCYKDTDCVSTLMPRWLSSQTKSTGVGFMRRHA